MIEKFFGRMKKGKGVSAQGSGNVMQFVMRHPIIVGMGFAKALLQKGKPATQTPS